MPEEVDRQVLDLYLGKRMPIYRIGEELDIGVEQVCLILCGLRAVRKEACRPVQPGPQALRTLQNLLAAGGRQQVVRRIRKKANYFKRRDPVLHASDGGSQALGRDLPSAAGCRAGPGGGGVMRRLLEGLLGWAEAAVVREGQWWLNREVR